MLRKVLVSATMVAAFGLGAALPASAQSISLNLGGFVPRSEDSRVTGDVLYENLNFLAYDIKEFKGVTFGGEFLFPLGNNLEAGVGLHYYQRTVPSVYADMVNSNGAEIEQDLKLRIVPITMVVRFMPLGRRASFQPYIGAGLGLLAWRYSESGEFVDFNDDSIFRDKYTANGTAVSPVIVGGIRIPLTRAFAFGGEVRYQKADVEIGNDFYGDRLDLGGISGLATFTFRY